jgi:hypothetical protein
MVISNVLPQLGDISLERQLKERIRKQLREHIYKYIRILSKILSSLNYPPESNAIESGKSASMPGERLGKHRWVRSKHANY